MYYSRIEAKEKRIKLRIKLRIEALDPKKRFDVYVHILAEIIKAKKFDYSAGFCGNFPNIWLVFDVTKRIIMFPELRAHKPRKSFGSGWWFNPWIYDTRIKILTTIIDEMTEKNSEK